MEIEVIHAVAKIAASKNQAERIRCPLDEPKKTIIPESDVNNDTIASNIIISCMNLLTYYQYSIFKVILWKIKAKSFYEFGKVDYVCECSGYECQDEGYDYLFTIVVVSVIMKVVSSLSSR